MTKKTEDIIIGTASMVIPQGPANSTTTTASLAFKLLATDKQIAESLFSVLRNATDIEKFVINNVNKFLELEDNLTIQISAPQTNQSLRGYYSSESNSITAFAQQDTSKLKDTLIHELVHYLIQKAFDQHIPYADGFMDIIKSVTSYVSSYIATDKLPAIQDQFFIPLQNITNQNMDLPKKLLESVKSEFSNKIKDECNVDDLNNLIEFSHSCGKGYQSFGLVLAEMLPRLVTLISKYQAGKSTNKLPECLELASCFLYDAFNDQIDKASDRMLDVIHYKCSAEFVKEILGNVNPLLGDVNELLF